MADFMHEVEDQLGTSFNTRSFSSWNDLIEYAKVNRNFIIIGLANSTSRSKFLRFSDSLISIPYVVVTSRRSDKLVALSDLYSKRVCTVRGYAVNDYIAEYHSELKPNFVKSDLEGLRGVSTGRFDAMIVNQMYASYLIEKHAITNLSVSMDFGFTNRFNAAVSIHDPELARIIEKAVSNIHPDRRRDLYQKWVNLDSLHLSSRIINILVGGIITFLIIVTALWLWSRKLQVEVRKRTSQLENQRQKSSDILIGTDAGTWEWNIITGEQIVNNRWAELIGYTLDELQPISIETMLTRINPDDSSRLNQQLDLVLSREMNYFDIEFRLRHKSNQWVWINSRGKITKWGEGNKPLKMSGIHLDITKRKRLEEIQAAHLRLIHYASSHTTKELLQEFLNEAEALTGSSIGFYHFLGDDQETISLQAWSTNTQEKMCSTQGMEEHYHVSKAGVWCDCIKTKEVVVHNDYNSLSHKKGLPEGHAHLARELVVPVLRDDNVVAILGVGNKSSNYNKYDEITVKQLADFAWEIIERKKAEDDKRRASDANKAKSTFLANMSHEIRTPMNAVLGFTSLLKKIEVDPKKLNYIDTIESSGKSLLELINNILDLSKIEAGHVQITPSEDNLLSTLDDLINTLSYSSKIKGLPIHKYVKPGFPHVVELDHTKLKQVMTNIIGNAIKFTSVGSISVNAEFTHVDNNQNMVDITLTVSDTGKGIPKDQQQRIFQAFKQVEGQSISEYEGTGLGLAISQSIMHAMDGEITIESKLGIGTQVVITLPRVKVLSNDSVAQMSDNYSAHDISFNNQSVLIVDDHVVNRNIIKEYLQNCNLELIEARDGLEALDRIKELNPDLVLLDMKMPTTDGYEVADIVHNDETMCHIPLIAVTASALNEDKERIAQLCDGYLAKPVSESELITTLKEFLDYSETEVPAIEVKHFKTKHKEVCTPNREMIDTLDDDTYLELLQFVKSGNMTKFINTIKNNKVIPVQLSEGLRALANSLELDTLHALFKDKHTNV